MSASASPAERESEHTLSAVPAPGAGSADEQGRAPLSGGEITLIQALLTWIVAWVALNVVSAVVAGAFTPAGEDPSIAVLTAIQFVGAGIFAAALLFASRRSHPGSRVDGGSGGGSAARRLPTFAEWRSDYRLEFVPRDLAALPLGVATQLLLVPLVYLPLRRLWPDTFNSERLSETAGDLVDRAGGGLTLVALFVAVCLVAPVVEEHVYRGLVQGAMMRDTGRVVGWVGASLLFALIHFRPVEYPGLFVAGLVFGGCLAITGRLAPAILCHLAFNVTGLLLAL